VGRQAERLSKLPRGSTVSSGQYFRSTSIRIVVQLRPRVSTRPNRFACSATEESLTYTASSSRSITMPGPCTSCT
jgi:hypothetical protein